MDQMAVNTPKIPEEKLEAESQKRNGNKLPPTGYGAPSAGETSSTLRRLGPFECGIAVGFVYCDSTTPPTRRHAFLFPLRVYRVVLGMGDVQVFAQALDRVLALGRDKQAREVELPVILVVRLVRRRVVEVHERYAFAVLPLHVRPGVVLNVRGSQGRDPVAECGPRSTATSTVAIFTQPTKRATIPRESIAGTRCGTGPRSGFAHDMCGVHSAGSELGTLEVKRRAGRKTRCAAKRSP